LLESSIRDGVCRLVIARPERRNALNGALLKALDKAVTDLSADTAVRVVIISGAGAEAFAAGADVAELEHLDPTGGEALSQSIADLHRHIRTAPFPVLAAVRGWCLGGGFELALACDVIIAAEDAQFALPEIRLGIIPGGGGLTRLLRTAGPSAARWLAFTGATIDAQRAHVLGIVGCIEPSEGFDAAVTETAARIARASPDAVRALKTAFAAIEDANLDAAIATEARIGAACYGTADQRRLMRRFLER